MAVPWIIRWIVALLLWRRILWLTPGIISPLSHWVAWVLCRLLLRHPTTTTAVGRLLHWRRLTSDSGVRRRTVVHKDAVWWRLAGECLCRGMPAVVSLWTRGVRWRGSRVQLAVGRHVRRRCIKLVVPPSHLDGPEHRLSKVNGAAALKHHLEACTAIESAVLLCCDQALDAVRPEHGLLDLHAGQGHKGRAEREHGIGGLFIVENHSMCRQVHPSRLLALELGLVLVVKVHGDVVAE